MKISGPELMCGRYACEVGGLWGKACGCTSADERAAREEEARQQAREEEEEDKETAASAAAEENRERWLGLHGIVLDASPLAERWMPEQHNEVLPMMQDWRTFWSDGNKLKGLGLNV